MNTRPRTIVGDLADWDLPTLEGRLDGLIEALRKKKLTITLDEDALGAQLYAQLFDRIRELGALAANEAIWGWLQGVADGRPELCIEFPYLSGSNKGTPLTIVYAVGAKDGSRAELRRTNLEELLTDIVASDNARRTSPSRVAHVASSLRKLADKLETQIAERDGDDGRRLPIYSEENLMNEYVDDSFVIREAFHKPARKELHFRWGGTAMRRSFLVNAQIDGGDEQIGQKLTPKEYDAIAQTVLTLILQQLSESMTTASH